MGGKTPVYLSNNIVRFDDGEKLKETEAFGITGSLTAVSLLKSRTNAVGQPTTLVFNQRTGFDEDLSLFVLLKENGKVNGGGTGMYFADRSDMKFSQKNFKEKIDKNPELKALFMTEVIEVLKGILAYEADSRPEVSTLSTSIMDIINNEMLAA